MFYVQPALVEMQGQVGPVLEETFAPILYVMRYYDLDAAIEQHNDVAAGLSSAIFTTDLREADRFLAASDCGIANVNLGTSGAALGDRKGVVSGKSVCRRVDAGGRRNLKIKSSKNRTRQGT